MNQAMVMEYIAHNLNMQNNIIIPRFGVKELRNSEHMVILKSYDLSQHAFRRIFGSAYPGTR